MWLRPEDDGEGQNEDMCRRIGPYIRQALHVAAAVTCAPGVILGAFTVQRWSRCICLSEDLHPGCIRPIALYAEHLMWNRDVENIIWAPSGKRPCQTCTLARIYYSLAGQSLKEFIIRRERYLSLGADVQAHLCIVCFKGDFTGVSRRARVLRLRHDASQRTQGRARRTLASAPRERPSAVHG
ncbi:hypothetical protein NDU88_002441 [Pleurodeles waltl]|uniref:Uncharacterized protein n=1 Tax=Pleurodeles waltl TaxID=8319 RepID=A0AAV7UBH4_PLEWA|nr:hypothetical protein NDU88_002441 [Pleurodeles waltl]